MGSDEGQTGKQREDEHQPVILEPTTAKISEAVKRHIKCD